MRILGHDRTGINGAREEIFDLIRRDPNKNINIYFDGWCGFRAATVLRSVPQVLPSMKDRPPKLCFGRIIYVDCSSWISKRTMQKVIAQQLRLNNDTMAMFDEHDEEDDFNGVDLGSRDAIRSVATMIDETLRESRFIMIFINGSDKEVVLGTLGIPEHSDCVVLWTFSARLITMRAYGHQDEIKKKLIYTDVFLWSNRPGFLPRYEFIALFHEEASYIAARYPCMRGMELKRVVDCCLYGLLLTYHTFRSTTGFAWSAHAPNFWICDGIILGDSAWEISNALHPEISFDCDVGMLEEVLDILNTDPKSPFLLLDSRLRDVYEERLCRWLSITTLSNNRAHEVVQTTLTGASSIFRALKNKHDPVGLPNGYFKYNRLMGRDLAASISKAKRLQVLILDGCDGFGDVVLPNNSTLRSFSLDGYGPASSHRTSTVELPPEMSRPKQPQADASNRRKKGAAKTSIISLRGCGRLDKPFLRGLPNLVELDLSGCAIKVLDFGSMVLDVPMLKRLFLIGYAHNVTTTGAVLQHAARASKETMMVGSNSDRQVHYCVAAGGMLMFGDVFTKIGDGLAPMQAFPEAPMEQSDRHIEIDGGSRSMQSEAEDPDDYNLASLMGFYTETLHVHNVSTCSSAMPAKSWNYLRWCRVERCPSLHAVFPPGAVDVGDSLDTIWASDLLMARCVWSKANFAYHANLHLKRLRQLHLRCCPSLRFALAMSHRPTFPNLETLHIIHCGDLRHVFVPMYQKSQHTGSVQFPKLTTIHLHDLPALQQICEGTKALAPALETIRIRGCCSLRRMPALKGRQAGVKKPTVEVEKDVWDALEWDGMDAGHHPSLYETPVHSRYYKRRMLRRTVLR
ncbi:hypothetical protein HU200_028418 [Digitaria exilis]|uniref:Disease resistance protein At4g27190-like leucine-rich repeats domain-containing protein n=1 Tax=Digitaria exilis TaxID=1010633 RepID=A0A835BRL4_9POAL|nr:hypothetical protein HU200_028418 [Digitaria exilis]